MHRLEPASRAVAPLVRWGVKNGREPERWGAGIRLVEEWSYFDEREPRLGAAHWLRYVPGVRHIASVLHYRLG